jgi:tripartite-type tricarboxylate transporter receptor subunit TctC
MAQVQAGKLTPIAVTTRERFKTAPEVPAIAETPGVERYDFPAWVALFAPAGTPPALLDRLNREAAEILAQPAVRAGLEKAGMTVSAETRAELAAFMKSESEKFRKVIGDAGIRGE